MRIILAAFLALLTTCQILPRYQVHGATNDLPVAVTPSGTVETLEQAAKKPAKDIFGVLKPRQFLLVLVVTISIQLTRKYIPAIPVTWMPVISPVLGSMLDYIGGQAGLWTGNATVGAMLGGLGVWFHQTQKQMGDPMGKMLPEGSPPVEHPPIERVPIERVPIERQPVGSSPIVPGDKLVE